MLDGRLARKNYLQISAFLDPVVVERGGFLTLYEKPLEEP